jgi:thioredoxin-dependent peroxiredoxin
MLEEGKKAPAFSLQASSGEQLSLKDFAGKKLVLYFYPKDNTPGCTTEALGFRDAAKQLEKLNAVVVGVSKDSIASHCKFIDKHTLNFVLLSDPEGEVLAKYGAWGEKLMYGKKTTGVLRSTIVIDESAIVRKIFRSVKVPGHVEKVLEVVASL